MHMCSLPKCILIPPYHLNKNEKSTTTTTTTTTSNSNSTSRLMTKL